MTLTNLINPQGRLTDIAKQVDLSTVQHAREIQKDRLTDKSLCDMWFWTADFPLYTMEKGQAVLYFASREHNLAFQNLDDAVSQLREKNNYFPKDSDISSVVKADSTLRIDLKDLKLQKLDNEWSYFEFKTAEYDKLNKTQRKFAERVHGEGKDFKNTMEMLKESGISTTRIYTLNPDYVKETLKENKAKSLARVSCLYIFTSSSNFFAFNRDIDSSGMRLRGVQSGAEGATQKIDEYDSALKLLTENPAEALLRIQKKPKYIAGLSDMVSSYIKTSIKA